MLIVHHCVGGKVKDVKIHFVKLNFTDGEFLSVFLDNEIKLKYLCEALIKSDQLSS